MTSDVSTTAEGGVAAVTILWISEGMSCDGDSVSITASSQPSIEDVVLGLIPGLPKVTLHNKVLSATLGGEAFLAPYRAAVEPARDLVVRMAREVAAGHEHHEEAGHQEVGADA